MAPQLGHALAQARIAEMHRQAEVARLVRSGRQAPARERRARRIERVSARLAALRSA
jgi:hypothetical protein